MRRLGILVILLAAFFWVGCSRRAAPGRSVPDFHLHLLDGRTVSLASYRGHVLVLNFWASYCVPCVQETPALNALAEKFPGGRAVVLGVSIDQDPVAYQTFLSRYHISFPTALDPSQDLMHRYGTQLIPETYIIGPDGRLDRKLVSVADWNSPAMVSYIRSLLPPA
ncbi:MAG TPA: TlpA disulfide reductase family protein [Terriglobales bacterium]|nr:TlpA disulfide reductase family protein [Terriglobales bacterium]